MIFPASSIKSQFPIFSHHPELVYLDNAATSQKPQSVIQSMTDFYEKENANVHRGFYKLSSDATRNYESVRKKTADLIGAPNSASVAFTKGTTEAINLISHGFIKKKLKPGDNIIITAMEHHANFIPWQQACKETGATLIVIPVDKNGNLDIGILNKSLSSKTKILAITHISNVLGTINPIEEIIVIAHKNNVPVLVDAAQSAGHLPIDLAKLGADFLTFSSHKMFGPFGTGVLYSKEKFHEEIDALNFGGGGIRNVEIERTTFLDYPGKLEAGTPNISGVIGFGAAIDFVQSFDINESFKYTLDLTNTFREKLKSINNVVLAGNPRDASNIVSFQIRNIHPHDIAGFLGNLNIAIRAGHHCAQPLLESMGIQATARVSFAVYNTMDDVNKTIDALIELKKFWS